MAGVSCRCSAAITDVEWPDRTLFFQWHRGDVPQADRAFAARSQQYKLVRPEPPAESRDHPQAGALRPGKRPVRGAQHRRRSSRDRRADARRLTWPGSGTSPRREGSIPSGSTSAVPVEDPTVLTRQDWRRPRAGVEPNDLGYWEVRVVARRDDSTVTFGSRPADSPRWRISHSAASSNPSSSSRAPRAARSRRSPGPRVPAASRPGSRATGIRPACWKQRSSASAMSRDRHVQVSAAPQ